VSMYPIASYNISSNTGTNGVFFNSIPQNFTHLQLRFFTRSYNGASGTNTIVQYNGDFGSNYAYHYVGGSGGTTFSGGGANQTSTNFGWVAGNNDLSNTFGVSVVDILDYTNTNKYKVSKAINGIDANGSGLVGMWSGLWLNTAAITQIFINPNGFDRYSTIQLYGITTA